MLVMGKGGNEIAPSSLTSGVVAVYKLRASGDTVTMTLIA